ncbi:hypothetical protein PILCRDRAFT_828465, partial [Piloderma croceum F 1598]
MVKIIGATHLFKKRSLVLCRRRKRQSYGVYFGVNVIVRFKRLVKSILTKT